MTAMAEMIASPEGSNIERTVSHETDLPRPTTTAEPTNDSSSTNGDIVNQKSALQDNIERKGKNAYYFAHAHKANGPQWDGKAEPKLLSKRSASSDESMAAGRPSSSFHYDKSNITSYAFSDEGKNVKLYITMEDVGEKCSDHDIELNWTSSSFCLVVRNYKDEPQCLSFGKLTANITNASWKKKKDRLVLILTKEQEGDWHTINDKGSPDHEVV